MTQDLSTNREETNNPTKLFYFFLLTIPSGKQRNTQKTKLFISFTFLVLNLTPPQKKKKILIVNKQPDKPLSGNVIRS